MAKLYVNREDDYQYEIFSQNNIEPAQTSVISARKTWYHFHVSTRLCKSVVSKQVKNVVAFFDQQKGAVSSHKNN